MHRGLTLIELVVVLAVLVALGGILVPLVGGRTDEARRTTTQETLYRVRDAVTSSGGYAALMRYVEDTNGDEVGYASGLPWPSPSDVTDGRADHPQLVFLFVAPSDLPPYDPNYAVGWREAWLDVSAAGRYAVDTASGFTLAYGENDDLTPLDGWANPIVLQLPQVDAGVTAQELEAVRLVSAGANGQLDTPADVLLPTSEQKVDDIVLYLQREDPSP